MPQDEREPLKWSYTKGHPLSERLRLWTSALLCQHVPGWTCAECKAKPDA